MATPDSANDPSERGFGVQALGFAVVGCASLAILQIFQDSSSSWAYQSFDTAVSRLYWAFVVPLAAVFDWGRRMFETRQAIRKAAVEKAIEKAVEKELDRIVASWGQLRKLPEDEAKQKILEVGQRSRVSDP